jgi:hypothetical protein
MLGENVTRKEQLAPTPSEDKQVLPDIAKSEAFVPPTLMLVMARLASPRLLRAMVRGALD